MGLEAGRISRVIVAVSTKQCQVRVSRGGRDIGRIGNTGGILDSELTDDYRQKGLSRMHGTVIWVPSTILVDLWSCQCEV
jgi:hypothetical protein